MRTLIDPVAKSRKEFFDDDLIGHVLFQRPMLMKFRLSADHEAATIAAIKPLWSIEWYGWEFAFPSYFAVSLEEDVNPYSVRDAVAVVAPEVNEKIGTIWRDSDGKWFQLIVNATLIRH